MTVKTPKYGFTGNERNIGKHLGAAIVKEIVALRDFGAVKKGDIGGWIELEANLSQNGTCWLGQGAVIFGVCRIDNNAWVTADDARIVKHTRLSGNSILAGKKHLLAADIVVNGNAVLTGERLRLNGNFILGDSNVVMATGIDNLFGRPITDRILNVNLPHLLELARPVQPSAASKPQPKHSAIN